MTPLAQALLEVDVATLALVNTLGRSDRSNKIRDRLKELRVAAAKAHLTELVEHPPAIEPKEAVRQVLQSAMRAGVNWHDIVGLVNTISEDRVGGGGM
jgi:hypothetical protein